MRSGRNIRGTYEIFRSSVPSRLGLHHRPPATDTDFKQPTLGAEYQLPWRGLGDRPGARRGRRAGIPRQVLPSPEFGANTERIPELTIVGRRGKGGAHAVFDDSPTSLLPGPHSCCSGLEAPAVEAVERENTRLAHAPLGFDANATAKWNRPGNCRRGRGHEQGEPLTAEATAQPRMLVC